MEEQNVVPIEDISSYQTLMDHNGMQGIIIKSHFCVFDH